MKELVILKIGGSLITRKDARVPLVNKKELERISTEIKEGYDQEKQDLILVHGAGSFGHPIVKRTRIHLGITNKKQVMAFAETQKLQNELNVLVSEQLIKKGVPAIPMQASASAIMKQGKLEFISTAAIKKSLEIGLVPVLFGVPAIDSKQGCSILSGDRITTYLAKELGAKKIVHATDVDGVFNKNPKKHKNAKLIEKINSKKILKKIGTSTHVDVTGGMHGKIKESLNTKTPTLIINGTKKDNIKKALLGKEVKGTRIN